MEEESNSGKKTETKEEKSSSSSDGSFTIGELIRNKNLKSSLRAKNNSGRNSANFRVSFGRDETKLIVPENEVHKEESKQELQSKFSEEDLQQALSELEQIKEPETETIEAIKPKEEFSKPIPNEESSKLTNEEPSKTSNEGEIKQEPEVEKRRSWVSKKNLIPRKDYKTLVKEKEEERKKQELEDSKKEAWEKAQEDQNDTIINLEDETIVKGIPVDDSKKPWEIDDDILIKETVENNEKPWQKNELEQQTEISKLEEPENSNFDDLVVKENVSESEIKPWEKVENVNEESIKVKFVNDEPEEECFDDVVVKDNVPEDLPKPWSSEQISENIESENFSSASLESKLFITPSANEFRKVQNQETKLEIFSQPKFSEVEKNPTPNTNLSNSFSDVLWNIVKYSSSIFNNTFWELVGLIWRRS